MSINSEIKRQQELIKANIYSQFSSSIEKGRKAQPGETRKWKDGETYRKQTDGTWKRVTKNRELDERSKIEDRKPKYFKVYRAIFLNDMGELDVESMGQSWATSEADAKNYAKDKRQVDDRPYVIVEAIVSDSAIDYPQTIAQHISDDYAHESEVVLNSFENIKSRIIEYNGEDVKGDFVESSTGFDRVMEDETREQPYNEDHPDWNDDLEDQIKETNEVLEEASKMKD